ncbi:MAG: hypothetical protein ACUVUC_00060, partial [Thermoguttaceae bacterium]
MDDPPVAELSEDGWAEALVHALNQQRTRVQQFLASQGDRLHQAHSELALQIERIADEQTRQLDQYAAELQSARVRQAQLTSQLEAACQRQAELEGQLEAARAR